MEKRNLYIDFDGVILDTITPTYEEIKELGISTQEEITEFFKNYDWKRIINDKYILNDSIECIKKIIESDKFYVSILTHVNSLEEAIIKIKYIRKYFSDITIIPCPKAISKTKMIHTKDAILIDDYANNLREWEKEDGIGIRFSLKNNGKGFIVINRLDQILELFWQKSNLFDNIIEK